MKYDLKRLKIRDLRKGQIILMVSYDHQDYAQDDEHGWGADVMRVVGIGAECDGHVGVSFRTDLPNAMLEYVKDRRTGDSVALGGSLGHLARRAAEMDVQKTHHDYMHVLVSNEEDDVFDAYGGYGDCALLLLAEHGLVSTCESCLRDFPVERLIDSWCAECATARPSSTKSRVMLQAQLGGLEKTERRYEEMKAKITEAGFVIEREDKYMRTCDVVVETSDAPKLVEIAAPYLATDRENHFVTQGISLKGR